MSTHLDANGFPAILLAFGYSQGEDRTTKVLAVREGRVVVRQLSPAEFDADYVACTVPFSIAIRAIESIARTSGGDLMARRTILFLMNAPLWRLRLVDCQLRLRALVALCTI